MAPQSDEGLHVLSCATPMPGHVSTRSLYKSLVRDEIWLLKRSGSAQVVACYHNDLLVMRKAAGKKKHLLTETDETENTRRNGGFLKM